MKMRPGPCVTTLSIGRPVDSLMKPSTEKMTRPANTEVKQFMQGTIIASLRVRTVSFVGGAGSREGVGGSVVGGGCGMGFKK